MGTTHDMDLSDPATFARAYDEHAPAVYGTALRVLGNPAAAQDVAQDVFLRVWRRPGTFDPRRGDLGAYLRLMARSRALDLWRTTQASGRATDRLKIVAGRAEVRPAAPPDGPRRGRRISRSRASSATSTGRACGPPSACCPSPSARPSCSPTGAG